MTTYYKRTEAPSKDDKNYIKTTYGGYNYCINISNGQVLPNCVGYAWGRWRELLGEKHNLSRGNAENWWEHKDEYERGSKPRLGAVACWKQGKTGVSSDGAGHVAIVEDYGDGWIKVSQSNYKGVRFEVVKYYDKGNGYENKGLEFQGFIYCPINYEEEAREEEPKKEEPKKDGLKVGDCVIIKEKGNANCYGTGRTAYGIGWKRYILRIMPGKPYPYKIGINGIATGWYKKEAIEKWLK